MALIRLFGRSLSVVTNDEGVWDSILESISIHEEI
jgi:hypothetical protein